LRSLRRGSIESGYQLNGASLDGGQPVAVSAMGSDVLSAPTLVRVDGEHVVATLRRRESRAESQVRAMVVREPCGCVRVVVLAAYVSQPPRTRSSRAAAMNVRAAPASRVAISVVNTISAA
jgi:hypothetical protein